MSNPEHPDSYPFHFRNQYRFWEPEWGFCIPHNLHKSLKDGDYKVEIETEFYEDQIEMVLHSHEGEHQDALLFVGHFDHPAQCGDGLLGCIAGHEIIRRLEGRQTKLSYKMLSTVEIVGSVFYAENRAKQDHVKEALFSAMSGVDAPLIYAQSFSEQAATDIAMRHVLKFSGEPFTVVPFKQAVGNDEIAYDVVGVDISCGSLMRWPHKYYHTSHDTNDKVNDEAFESYIEIMLSVIDILENNAIITAKFSGLPSLAHPDTDLYLSPPFMSGMKHAPNSVTLRVLNSIENEQKRAQAERVSDKYFYMMNLIPRMANGEFTTLDIAEKSGIPFYLVDAYLNEWEKKGLIEKSWVNPFQKADI